MDSRGSDEASDGVRVLDYRQPRDRRRFYLDRGLRKQGRGAGSDLRRLMSMAREEAAVKPESLFGDVPAVVVGGVAARAYAPERQTKDIDFLVDHEHFAEATNCLRREGWHKKLDLTFPNTALGLHGEAWEKDGLLIDVIATGQDWGSEALREPTFDQTGLRVIPLAYLVLMKLDSARGVDQGDHTRMLGRLEDREVDAITKIVERHSHDPQAADDVRQYALLGQMEWELPEQ
jgi:hypothetical protein